MDGELTVPVVGPDTGRVQPAGAGAGAGAAFRLPRLARHLITLDDGHQVGVAVSGRGVPLVVVHGFTAEGILYAQTLSRIVDLGFKVVAIDAAGHGGTLGLPTGAGSMAAYTELLGRAIDHLGIERAVLMGHSMGGRLVTEWAANEPDRTIAVITLDGIVGASWDRLMNVARVFPPVLVGVAVVLIADIVSTVPLFRDPEQARKLGRLVLPTLIGHVRRPWRLLGPAVSLIRSRGSGWMLDKIAQERIPFFAVTGDRDLVVPPKTARDAARRARGDEVIVHNGAHSWLLKDPESLPAIMLQLMRGRLGTAVLKAKMRAGLDPGAATHDEIEAAFFEPGALALRLSPPHGEGPDLEAYHRRPRYRFTVRLD